MLIVLVISAETFGPQHRPVIEFAVDNVQKLKIREAKQQQFQQRDKHNESEQQQFQQHDKHKESEQQQQSNGEAQVAENKYKRKTREGDNTGPRKENAARFKKGPVRPREESKEEAKSNIAVKEDVAEKKRPTRTQEKPSSNQRGQWMRQKEANEKPNPKISKDLSNDSPKKRKLGDIRGEESINGQRKRKKQGQGQGGAEVVDKLDMLIEQYRSKFSQSSGKTGPQKQSSGQVRRWFQS